DDDSARRWPERRVLGLRSALRRADAPLHGDGRADLVRTSMTRALAPCLAVLLAACASSPSPSSAPPAAPPVAQQPATPTPAAGPLACERDEDCTVFDDCGECKPLSVHTCMEPAA